VAAALKSLTVLRLESDALTRLSRALAKITSLCELDLEGNLHLQLSMSDLKTVAALPNLRVLKVAKGYRGDDINSDANATYRFTQQSLGVLLAISKRLPHLDLPGLQ